MITLTKLNGMQFSLNAELIETIEETPDTVITTRTGKKYVVRESEEAVIQSVIAYKRLIYSPV